MSFYPSSANQTVNLKKTSLGSLKMKFRAADDFPVAPFFGVHERKESIVRLTAGRACCASCIAGTLAGAL